MCEVPYCIFRTFLLLYSHRKRITLSLLEAIPPHHSLIVHSIMTRKESKVIVMIALGSLFFWRQRDQENPFGLHFFIFGVLWSFRIPPLRQHSDGQDWADKWARIEGDNITRQKSTGPRAKCPGARFFFFSLCPPPLFRVILVPSQHPRS